MRANASLVITLPAGAVGNVSELTFNKKLTEIDVKDANGNSTKLTTVKENQHLILNVTLDGLHNLAVSATLSDWTIATANYGSTANTDDANYGLETEPFNGGNRYLIRNATDLQLFADMVNLNTGTSNAPIYPNADANARVTSDFTFALTEGWIGIGNGSRYNGIFDGDGHTIHLTDIGKSGLFGNIGSGVVRGLTLAGLTNGIYTNITNNNGIVGAIANTNNGTIENCQVKGFENRSNSAGGLVGENSSSGIIRACAVYDCYLQARSRAGGLVATNEGTITACIAIPFSVGDDGGSIYSGWLVGQNTNKISYCACIAGSKGEAFDVIGSNNGTSTNNGICTDLAQLNSTTLKADGTGEGGIAILNTAKITLIDNYAYYWAPGKGKNAPPVLTLVPDPNKGETMQIATAQDLCLFAIVANAGNGWINATLTNDISMKGINVWKAIYYSPQNAYRGNFDGAHHAILDFAPTTMITNGDYAGLFGAIDSNVKDLTLRRGGYTLNTEVSSAGSLAGRIIGTLTNCHVEDFTITAPISSMGYLGSLTGVNSATATACTATRCNVKNTGTTAASLGGLIGASSGSLTACAAYACTVTNYIDPASNTRSRTGGLTGVTQNALTACIATPVSLTGSTNYTGYLVGENYSTGNIFTCAYSTCTGATKAISENNGITDNKSFALYKTDGSGALVDGTINTLNTAITNSTVSGINKEWQWTAIGARPVKK